MELITSSIDVFLQRCGLIRSEREAVMEVFPSQWRTSSAPVASIDRLKFVHGLRRLGLDRSQTDFVMRILNQGGLLAGRLAASEYVAAQFRELVNPGMRWPNYALTNETLTSAD